MVTKKMAKLKLLIFLITIFIGPACLETGIKHDTDSWFKHVRRDGTEPPPWTGRPDLFEGDIKLDGNALAIIQGSKSRGAAVARRVYLWPKGEVPYTFDPSLNAYQFSVSAIKAAMKKIEDLSCIRFKLRTSEPYFVRFIRGAGCWSYVGRCRSGGQSVSIGRGCDTYGTILHELMHTLGFFHTSSRPDRDAYVIVHQRNIFPGFQRNFQKFSYAQVDRLGAPYDLNSLMHLHRTSWSKNGQSTIEARSGAGIPLGAKESLSEIDKQQLNQLYSCVNYKGCFTALGMEKGKISDSSISASSSTRYHEPNQARLFLTASSKGSGSWCSAKNSIGQYIQIDFGQKRRITAIAVQGMMGLFGSSWVSSFNVQISDSKRYWQTVAQNLRGNWDSNSVRYNVLPSPRTTQYLRVLPTHWYNGICLRLEVYGC